MACGHVLQRPNHPFLGLVQPTQAQAALCRHAGTGQCLLPEHLLHLVLGYPLRVFGEAVIALGGAVEGVLEAGEFMAIHAGGKHHVGRVVDPEGRGIGQVAGDAPAAQQLAGAHVGGLGTWCQTGARLAFDQQTRPALLSQLQGQRQAHRTGANDEHPGFGGDFGLNGHRDRSLT